MFRLSQCRRLLWIVPCLLAAAAPRARADTTLRYKLSFKSGGMLSASALAASGGPALPPEFVIRLQGEKARVDGGIAPEIVDLGLQQITLLDPTRQRFSTASLQDYQTQFAASLTGAALPPAMLKAMSAIKVTSSSHQTGQTDTILGIQAEETDMTLIVTLDLPDPSGASAAALQGPILRLEMQLWTALPSESSRVAALARMETFNQLQTLVFNPVAASQKILDQLPEPLRDNLNQVFSTFSQQKALLLRMHGSLYMPMLAGLLQVASQARANSSPDSASAASAQQKAALAALGSMDPRAPLGEMTMEASELSDTPVEPALFAIPDGYQAEPLPDLLKAVKPAPPKMPPAAARPPRPNRPALPDVPKLEPGAAVPTSLRDWFAGYVGQSSHAAIIRPEFRTLLQSITPDSSYHMGGDMPLADAVFDVLHGPAFPVERFPDGTLILGAKRAASGRGKAWVWLDPVSGQAIGGLLLFFADNRPSPALTLFSTQIAGPVDHPAQLPAAFVADFRQWSAEHQLPAFPAEFFVNHDGATSVILHPPATCGGAGASLCDAVNNDAADTDMQAAYYLLQQHFPAGAAAAEIASEQKTWLQTRTTACAAPTNRESPLACRARLTRKRAQALTALDAHPPGAQKAKT